MLTWKIIMNFTCDKCHGASLSLEEDENPKSPKGLIKSIEKEGWTIQEWDHGNYICFCPTCSKKEICSECLGTGIILQDTDFIPCPNGCKKIN